MSKRKKKKAKGTKKMQFQGYVDCPKVHDGTSTVVIGGFPLVLTSSYKCKVKLDADAVLPLNGDLGALNGYAWGEPLPLIYRCGMTDHGGVPPNWADFINEIAAHLREGWKIAAWCHGSHGRTGCFGASLIAVMEPDIADPIAAIRERHCQKAVESKEQAEAVFKLKGLELPAVYAEEFKPVVHYSTFSGGGTGSAKRYFHDIKFCECGKCGDGQYWQTYPCQCLKYVQCETDRKNYAGAIARDMEILTVAGEEIPAHTAGSDCLCQACIDTDCNGHPDVHKSTTSGCGACYCRLCTVRWKSEGRKILIPSVDKHAWDCICNGCWDTEQTHPRGCTCALCVYLNTGAPDALTGLVQHKVVPITSATTHTE